MKSLLYYLSSNITWVYFSVFLGIMGSCSLKQGLCLIYNFIFSVSYSIWRGKEGEEDAKRYMCVCVYVRRVKFYFLSRFQLYNKVLSTIVTTIYIRSWDLIHRATESLYPFANLSSLFLPPCSPWQPLFYSLFLWVWLFKKIPHINDTM